MALLALNSSGGAFPNYVKNIHFSCAAINAGMQLPSVAEFKVCSYFHSTEFKCQSFS